VIFHSDRGSTYTAYDSPASVTARHCAIYGPDRSCLDNAAAESFLHAGARGALPSHFKIRQEAQEVIVKWVVGFHNCRPRHSSCGMQSPIDYETSAADRAA
jgi:putative transposase